MILGPFAQIELGLAVVPGHDIELFSPSPAALGEYADFFYDLEPDILRVFHSASILGYYAQAGGSRLKTPETEF
jgi:hypothetical protein